MQRTKQVQAKSSFGICTSELFACTFCSPHFVSQWVDRQRAKKNSLSDAKVEKLGKIGFRWAKPRFKTKWEWKYRELCQYYRQHGHSDVRTKCPGNPALGRWASKQRAEYKKFLGGGETCITREQVEKLNLVDFQWSAKPRYYRAPVPETGDAPKENGPSRAL